MKTATGVLFLALVLAPSATGKQKGCRGRRCTTTLTPTVVTSATTTTTPPPPSSTASTTLPPATTSATAATSVTTTTTTMSGTTPSQPSVCPDTATDLEVLQLGNDVTREVTITSPTLIRESGKAAGIVVTGPNARLVIGDTGNIQLEVRHIHVTNNASLHIGSPDCRYQGLLDIELMGRTDDGYPDVPGMGKKFLGADNGARVEIHGAQKLSWTFLARTVLGAAFQDTLTQRGFNAYHISSAGEVLAIGRFDTWWEDAASAALAAFIDQIPTGDIFATAVKDEGTINLQEDARSRMRGMGSAEIGNLGYRDPFVFAGVKGNPGSAVEQRITYDTPDTTDTATITFTTGAAFQVTLLSGWISSAEWALANMTVAALPEPYVIALVDDASSWNTGDRIVIASTDFSMYQAEEFTLLDCPTCASNGVKIDRHPSYTHWGEISEGIDMRAEVGMLTRNIKIHGRMEALCYSGDHTCNFFDYDTFGGHTIFSFTVGPVHVEGVELFDMGQQRQVGRYPLHFHMALDKDEDGCYLRGTSVYRSYSRAVTIHGTSGVTVEDVVGYDVLGHCFFLEDGSEQRNTFRHNLGLLTRPGLILPTDRDDRMCTEYLDNVVSGYTPAAWDSCRAQTVFWIAHPNNNFIDNAAAGSEDTGFWFIFHLWVTGPSKDLYPLPGHHGERSPMGVFQNNRAHSNRRNGFRIDNGVKTSASTSESPEEFLALVSARYKPHVNSDLAQPRVPAVIDGLVLYKNRQRGTWVRGGDIFFRNCQFGDNGIGATLASEGAFPNDQGSHQEVSDSVFVGETSNRGTNGGGNLHWGTGADGRYRTLPQPSNYPQRGFELYDGPNYCYNCSFSRYQPTAERNTSAVGFFKNDNWQLAPLNSLPGATFDAQSLRIYGGRAGEPHFNNHDLDGDLNNIMHDEDGSVSGSPGSYLVRIDNYVLRNEGCVEVPEWQLARCPGKYAQMWPNSAEFQYTATKMVLVKELYPSLPLVMRRAQDYMTQYQPALELYGSYSMHWVDGPAPKTLKVYAVNFDSGDYVTLALCYPSGTTFTSVSYRALGYAYGPLITEVIYSPVASLAEVGSGTNTYYYDTTTSLLHVRLEARAGRERHDYCSTAGCEVINVEATWTQNGNADCR